MRYVRSDLIQRGICCKSCPLIRNSLDVLQLFGSVHGLHLRKGTKFQALKGKKRELKRQLRRGTVLWGARF